MSSSNTKRTEPRLPPKPKPPEPYECCERGCDPCIYDYYAQALARWEQKLTKLQQRDLDK